jgi:hypothetical protein
MNGRGRAMLRLPETGMLPRGVLASAETEKPVVKALFDDFDDLNFHGGGVLWVEKVVPGVWSDGGGNARQRSFARGQPVIANLLRNILPCSPVRRRRMIDLSNGEVVGHRDLQKLILVR